MSTPTPAEPPADDDLDPDDPQEPEPTDPAGGGDDPQDEPDPEGADQLGDAGKQALDRMKAKLKSERDRRKAAEAERDQLKTGKPAEGGQPDPEAIRAEADRAATARANARIVRSEIKAAAAGKLADPRDALAFLDTAQFEVDEDGQVDEDEIADAIDDLLTRKPHLAAATAGKPRFHGSGDGGARKGTPGPKQYSEQDVKKMTPEQIDEAHRKGQLRDYLGG